MKLLLSLAFCGLAAASNMVTMDKRTAAPHAWVKGARAASASVVTVHAMIKHDAADVKKLEAKLMAVSDPRSADYGKHLTVAEIGQLTPIPAARLAVVKDYFKSAQSMVLTPNQDILAVTLTVEAAEELFGADVHVFTHASGVQLARTDAYSLPPAVAEALYVVADLIELPRLDAPITTEAGLVGGGNWDNACPDLKGCQGLVTPAVLKKAYSIDDSGMDAANNSFAVAEFQNQYYKQTDLDKFGQACGVDVTVDVLVGGNKNTAGVEAELDIEYIKGVSPGIPLTVVYSNSFSLIDWMTTINAEDGSPWIHSVSYGNDEAQQTSTAYMLSCNVQFMKSGVRGVSVLFASGDQGVCGREGCRGRFHPDFPAASPYITAVGGTDFLGSDIGAEQAWSAGGGGFSDTFPIPDYQAEAVAGYLNSPDADLPAANKWNSTGRGYPDVSALGGQKASYCVVTGGRAAGVAGTSASCPVAAAVFGRLNGLRLSAGNPVLGFLNPWIYQNADAFNDVQAGCNDAGGNIGCFKAIKGWDAATGVGTPNYAAMAKKI